VSTLSCVAWSWILRQPTTTIPLSLSQNLKPLVILKTIVACSEQTIVIRLAEKDGDMALKAMRFLNLLLAGVLTGSEFAGFVGFHLAWNISVEASCALGRCQRYPLYDVRSFSRQELVAPHELYLPYRPPPEVNPTKARDLSNKLRRNPTGEPNHVRVRQVAGRDVDEPFAARLGNAMVRHPSELPAKRVKSLVVRKYLREDGGRGEIESPHSKVETGL
jgi:hypothetical protein